MVMMMKKVIASKTSPIFFFHVLCTHRPIEWQKKQILDLTVLTVLSLALKL